MRKLILLILIQISLFIFLLSTAHASCDEMEKIGTTGDAKQILKEFLLRDVPKSGFRTITTKDKGKFLLVVKPVEGLPRNFWPRGTIFWGVKLGGPKKVVIISAGKNGDYSVADLSFTILLNRNIEDQDELVKVYSELHYAGRGTVLEGSRTGPTWFLKFGSIGGFLLASQIISRLPRELIRYAEFNYQR